MRDRSEIATIYIDKDTSVLAEIAHLGGEEDVSVSSLKIDDALDAVKGIASRIHDVLATAKPQKATVEFGVKLATSSGQLLSLLVDASGDANFKIILEWEHAASEQSHLDRPTDERK